ncbi:hypothetical protein ACFST9_13555 [Hymenobacter monticola]|uniref:hypothetical protein n=1 Tax=Hymenobacter monticola TaxID=1705399 RepID=UPI00364151AD
MSGLPFDYAPTAVRAACKQPAANTRLVIRTASFGVDKPADTYLDLRAWGRGVMWMNGHKLECYGFIGSQQTSYVLARWLKKGYKCQRRAGAIQARAI